SSTAARPGGPPMKRVTSGSFQSPSASPRSSGRQTRKPSRRVLRKYTSERPLDPHRRQGKRHETLRGEWVRHFRHWTRHTELYRHFSWSDNRAMELHDVCQGTAAPPKRSELFK